MKRRAFLAGMVAAGLAPSLPDCTTAAGRHPFRVGYLSGNLGTPSTHPAFIRAMQELGYLEGRDLEYVYQGPSTSLSELRRLAAELVALGVDVIVAAGGSAQLAAADATKTIPIVLVVGPDPRTLGLVESIARPGGNATGVAVDFVLEGPKKLQILKDTVPTLQRVAALYRSDNTSIESARAAQLAGPDAGVEVITLGFSDLTELDAVLDQMRASRFDGIIATSVFSAVSADPSRLPAFAGQWRIPQVLGDIQLVEAGGLMHYGTDFEAVQARSAVFVDKILKGASPGQLPVEFATQSDFVVNLGAAERLGLKVPDNVLRRATRVIAW